MPPFAQSTSVIRGCDAWDSMLAASRRLAELLHADLLDDKHAVFTRQRSMEIKEELREYERKNSPDP